MTTLVISNEEIKDILEIVKYLEESGLLNEDVSEALQNESKEQKFRFLDILLGRLADSLLGNVIVDQGVIRPSEGTIKAVQYF